MEQVKHEHRIIQIYNANAIEPYYKSEKLATEILTLTNKPGSLRGTNIYCYKQ